MSWLPAILRPRVAHNSGLYQYHRAPFYPVGAGDAVYEPAPPVVAAMLPIVQLIGAAIMAGSAPSPTQGQQVYANQTGLVAGIGGVTAGSIMYAPLNIPDTTNGAQ